MTVIDKLLNEWSFRCHDGIVDLNDPNKVKILEEITKDEIKNLIDREKLNPEQLEKIERFIKGKTKRLGLRDELQKVLEKRGLKRIAPLIVYYAEYYDTEEKLLEYIKKPKEISLSDKGNLVELFSNSGLPENFIKKLIQVTSNQLGVGELALVTFMPGAKKIPGRSGQGDIQIGEEIIEVKGNEAALSEWSSKVPIKKAFNKIYGIDIDVSKDNWLTKLENDLQGEDKEKAKKVIKILYPNFKIDLSDPKNLRKNIAKNYTDLYFKDSKITSMLIVDELTGNYKKYNKEEFKNELGKNIAISFNKDAAPRISLGKPAQEEPTLEEILSSLEAK